MVQYVPLFERPGMQGANNECDAFIDQHHSHRHQHYHNHHNHHHVYSMKTCCEGHLFYNVIL